MAEDIAIQIVTTVDDDLVEALSRLVTQLGSANRIPTFEQIQEIVNSPCTTLLIARNPAPEGQIVGSLILIMFRLGSGLRAWIEDVVVEEGARRRGVGEALVRRALALAVEAGARTVDLTSRPSREAANRLYRRLGFVERETNVYRWSG